jgi:tRNA A37 threonylcarbamoyladenosine dehydratase
MADFSWLERTELLLGEDQLGKLINSNVLVVGLGGVGSFAAEFVCRAGVGKMTIVDGDIVDNTNKNRQLPALTSTVGMGKAEVMANRLKDINPNLSLTVIDKFQRPEDTIALIRNNKFDYVMDCIDSVSPKLFLIITCVEENQRFISSMGAGGKTDASAEKVVDISKTYNCPFAKIVRKRLHKHKIYSGFKTVFNYGPLHRQSLRLTDGSNFKKSFYGTISFMPALFGLQMAAEVLNDLRQEN